jgi:hypothetical protein
MRKNCKLRIRLETEVLQSLKKQAEQEGITLSELCRQKLMGSSKLTEIEIILQEIQKKLNTKLNLNRRYKNGNKIA